MYQSKRTRARFAPVVLTLALAPFLFNLTGYFLADDLVLLSWTHVDSVRGVLDFFDPNTFWFYRPLVKVYYWMGQSLFGLHPVPFHLFSAVLHLANGWLVYKLVSRQPRGGTCTGLIAALIFMLVPYHAETVSWIAATGDLIAALSILSSLLLFQLHAEQGKRLLLVFSIALFGVGLLARETTMILPLLLVAAMFPLDPNGSDVEVTRRTQATWMTRRLVGYIAVAILYIMVNVSGQSGSVVARGGLAFHALSIDSILLGVSDYLLGLFPGGRLVAGLPLDTLRWIVWVEAAIVIVVAVVLWRRGQKLALFGLVWMVLSPLLFIFFSAPTDRYFYLPSIGYAILIASVVMLLGRWLTEGRLQLPHRISAAAVTVIVTGLLLSQVAPLLAKLGSWRSAGEASARVFHDLLQAVPEPHDYGAFYFVNVPATLNGVPFLGAVVEPAVQLEYDNKTLTASSVTCASLHGQAELPTFSYIFRFKGDGVRQLISPEECR